MIWLLLLLLGFFIGIRVENWFWEHQKDVDNILDYLKKRKIIPLIKPRTCEYCSHQDTCSSKNNYCSHQDTCSSKNNYCSHQDTCSSKNNGCSRWKKASKNED